MKLTRIRFLKGTLAMGAVAVVGCGDDTGGGGGSGSGGSGSGGDTGTGTGTASCTAAIATNHGHILSVSQADVDAAVDKTYSISGSSPHDHMVTITAAEFATLAGGGSISVTSDDGGAGHTLAISVSC